VLRERGRREFIEQTGLHVIRNLSVPFVIKAMLDHLAKTEDLLAW